MLMMEKEECSQGGPAWGPRVSAAARGGEGQPPASPGQAFPGLTQVVGAGGGKKGGRQRGYGSCPLEGTRQEPLGTWASLKSSPCQPGFYVWPRVGERAHISSLGILG